MRRLLAPAGTSGQGSPNWPTCGGAKWLGISVAPARERTLRVAGVIRTASPAPQALSTLL